MDQNNMYQILVLELSDGREIKATIRPFLKEGDKISIVGIKVTEPKEMPEDCKWSSMGEDKMPFEAKVYIGEPCRICGEKIKDANGLIWVGYSKDIASRTAHGRCWKENKPRSEWAYPKEG